MTNRSQLDAVVRLAKFTHGRVRQPFLRLSIVVLVVAGIGLKGRDGVAQPADDGFHTIPPCRLVDTRQAAGPLGGPALAAGALRFFTAVGNCQIPDSAVAVSANVTVVSPTAAGHLRLFAGGTARPATSTINYAAGQTRANNAVVAIGVGGSISAVVDQPSGTTHMVLDVTGYFGATGCTLAQRLAMPLQGFNGANDTVFWTSVAGATSYTLYIRAEPGECGLLHDVFVTRADQSIPDVTSPYDVSAFNKCDTCYFVDVVAVGDCDSPLASDLGYPAPGGFGAGNPCTP